MIQKPTAKTIRMALAIAWLRMGGLRSYTKNHNEIMLAYIRNIVAIGSASRIA